MMLTVASCETPQEPETTEAPRLQWSAIPADEAGMALTAALDIVEATIPPYPLATMAQSFDSISGSCPEMLHTTATTAYLLYKSTGTTERTGTTSQALETETTQTTDWTTYAKVTYAPVTTTTTTTTTSTAAGTTAATTTAAGTTSTMATATGFIAPLATVTIIQVQEAFIRETMGRFTHEDAEGNAVQSDGYRLRFRVMVPEPPPMETVELISYTNPCGE